MNPKTANREVRLSAPGYNREAVARIGPLINLPVLLSELGHEAETLLASHGFQRSQFEYPDSEIPYLRGSRLLEHCVKVTGHEDLGLMLGMRADPSCLGIAGFMVQTAPDVKTALRALVHHFSLHDEGGVPSLHSSGDFSYLGFDVILPEAHATDQMADMSMVVACKILRGFFGDDWNPIQVHLARPKPEKLTAYKKFFITMLRFNSDRSAVVFPTRLLQQALPNHIPQLFEYLEQKATELHGDKKTDIIGQLHRFLRSALITHECYADAAARHLGVNKRTLNRLLHNEGTSFREELNKLRYALAQSYLANSSAKQMEICLALGYTDVTAFNRAFKRWSGLSPEEWRSRNGTNKKA